MVCVNCVFISHSSTRGHVQSRAPGIEDKGHHVFCAVVGARPDLKIARVLAGGRGVVLGMSSQRESAAGRANGTYWLSLIGWSVPETVYVSGRRGVPGAT